MERHVANGFINRDLAVNVFFWDSETSCVESHVVFKKIKNGTMQEADIESFPKQGICTHSHIKGERIGCSQTHAHMTVAVGYWNRCTKRTLVYSAYTQEELDNIVHKNQCHNGTLSQVIDSDTSSQMLNEQLLNNVRLEIDGTGSCKKHSEVVLYTPEQLGVDLDAADIIVAYNHSFDLGVISKYFPGQEKRMDLWKSKHLDIFETCKTTFDQYVSLNDLCEFNELPSKTGKSMSAINQFHNGKIRDLVEYCANDVLCMRNLYYVEYPFVCPIKATPYDKPPVTLGCGPLDFASVRRLRHGRIIHQKKMAINNGKSPTGVHCVILKQKKMLEKYSLEALHRYAIEAVPPSRYGSMHRNNAKKTRIDTCTEPTVGSDTGSDTDPATG